MERKQCISVKALYEKYGDHLTYCDINYTYDEKNNYHDLVDKRNRGILCMDGEFCEVLLEANGIVVLLNDGVTFCLTREEYYVAVLGFQSIDSIMGVSIGNILYVPSETVRSAIPYKVSRISRIYQNGRNFIIEAESEDPDKITFDPVIYIPAAEIGKTAFLNQDDAIHTLKAYQEYAESVNPKKIPAALLPEGWTWEMYDDGSGCLKSPEKERFYEYDRSTREYRISSDTPWIYGPERLNDLQDFRSWAEARILPLI